MSTQLQTISQTLTSLVKNGLTRWANFSVNPNLEQLGAHVQAGLNDLATVLTGQQPAPAAIQAAAPAYAMAPQSPLVPTLSAPIPAAKVQDFQRQMVQHFGGALNYAAAG